MNDVTFIYYISLVETKFLSKMERIAYSSSFTPCRNRNINIRSNFAVNRYEFFVENKNTLRRTFCGCKKKANKKPQLYQNFTGSYKKSVKALDELQDTHNIQT